ncbi:MAG: biotin synthase BioB, partial [Planctomycetota bacterium]|nr:biotin synthase BioB [Planctomycetota bacterium]
MHPILRSILAKAARAEKIDRRDAESLIPILRENLPDVMAAARIAASASGVRPFTCGIVNAKSGQCGEDCAFCAQSNRHGAAAPSTPLLDEDALLKRAETYAADSIDHMSMVTAGRGPAGATLERLCGAARKIRERVGIRLCASLGIIDAKQARALKDAGFERYHHNLETSRSVFPSLCSTHSFDERLATVACAKAAGLKTCSGGIFGFGESWADRLDFFADLETADPDAIPVNILIPVPGTPFGGARAIEPWEGLALIAVLRLMHPSRTVIMCAGRTSSLGEFGNWVYSAGANAIMVGDYLTRKGNDRDEDFRFLQMIG